MILEIAIGAACAAAGVTLLTAVRRRGRRRELAKTTGAPESEGSKSKETKSGKRKSAEIAKKAKKRVGPRGYRVGDVVLHLNDELWLAGSFELDEEGYVCTLFSTPGAETPFLLQHDSAAREVSLMQRLEVPEGDLPIELPHQGFRYKLSRKGDAQVTRAGDQLPPGSERAKHTAFRAAGGKVLFVLDFTSGDRLALVGETVDKALLDLLPGGDLEE